MALLSERDSLRFWGSASATGVGFQIPIVRDDRSDQRGRWPGGEAPDWDEIARELAASRSAYFLQPMRGNDDRETLRILTGRLVVQIDRGQHRGRPRLWLSGRGRGVRFASNFDRREFVSAGLPIRHEGIWLGNTPQFERKYKQFPDFLRGWFVQELWKVVAAAAARGEEKAALKSATPASAAEVSFLARLETVVDADHELEQRAAQEQPGFSYFAARSEPSRSSAKRHFRLTLVDADYQRFIAESTPIKVLALEHADGQRVFFELEDSEPKAGSPEIIVSTARQTNVSDIPTSGMVTRAASDSQYRARKRSVEDLRFRRANNRWLLGHAAGERPYEPLVVPSFTPPDGEMLPNPSQLDAIAKGLATDDYMLVLGPPGTGKTTVISRWVEKFVSEGKRVLVTSQNNRAVDNVLERLARNRDLTCVRIGNESKLSASMQELLIDNCAVSLQRGILSNIDLRWSAVQNVLLLYQRMLQALASATEPELILREIRLCVESIESDLGPLRSALGIDSGGAWAAALATYRAFLEQYAELSAARRAASARRGWLLVWFWLLAFFYGFKARSVLRSSIRARALLHDLSAAHSQRLDSLVQTISAWHRTLTTIRQQALYPLLLQLVDVVGSTCIGIDTSRYFKDALFDVVIVDEAGQIQIHNLIVPMAKGERVILVGDHKQLPPVADEKLLAEVAERFSFEGGNEAAKEAERLLSSSWFENMWLRTPASRKTMLDTQFRCPALISDFISEAFYEGGYFAAEAMKSKKPLLEPFASTVVFIDTSTLPARQRHEQSVTEGTRQAVSNRCEAELVLSVLELLAIRRAELFETREVGVISPLKKHVEQIATLVGQAMRAGRLPSEHLVPTELVATVDSYQGQERDVIIFPFTRSNAKNEVGFWADWRRLNVAMTRAKRQLVFIGDLSTLTAAPRADGRDAEFKAAMRLLKRYLDARGQLVRADDWLRQFGPGA